MKRFYAILFISMLLVTGCGKSAEVLDKQDDNKQSVVDENNSTDKNNTDTSKKDTTNDKTNSNKNTAKDKENNNKTNTTVKNENTKPTKVKTYSVKLNGKEYNIGDTVTLNVTLKTNEKLIGGNFYVYVMKSCDSGEKFNYLEEELEVEVNHLVYDVAKGDPDKQIEDAGYCGHGYYKQIVSESYLMGEAIEAIDFSNGKKVLNIKVKFKKEGNYVIKVSGGNYFDTSDNTISNDKVILSLG